MREIEFAFNIPSPADSLDSLNTALTSALGAKFGNVSYSHRVVRINLSDDASQSDEATAIQVIQTHNYSTRTPEQIALAQRKTDFLEIIGSKADTAVTTIGTELATLTQLKTDLAAAGSLAAVKPIVDSLISIIQAQDQRQRALIKALQRVGDFVV